jgi:hypothetical protein
MDKQKLEQYIALRLERKKQKELKAKDDLRMVESARNKRII